MSELKNSKQNRATIKGQLTRLNNTIEATAEVSEAKVKATKIKEYWKAFQEIQDRIDEIRIGAAGDADAELEAIQQESDAEREVFETIYFQAEIKLQTIIDAEQARKLALDRAAALHENRNNNGNVREIGERRIDVKLPTLQLPEFKGDYQQWLLFKDAFKSMIHDNAAITAIQKFQYLRSSLSGEALQVIRGLTTTAANYEGAWELLEKHYENKKYLINTHLNQLLDFPTVTKDKPSSMRQLIVHVQTHLKALKSLELPVDEWDVLIIHMLKRKMDFNTQKDWEEKTHGDRDGQPTLEEYLQFLDERCRTLEIIEKGKNKQDSSKAPTAKKTEKKVALASVSQTSCAMCNESHSIYRCPQFLQLSISDRIKEAKSRKLCTNCLGKGHFSVACRSSTCKQCDKKHNTMLHLPTDEQPKTDEKSNSESTKKSVVTHCAKNDSRKNQGVAIPSEHFVRKTTSQVILSTARVEIEDFNGDRHICRVLLDPGSQSNIITEELVRKLKVPCKTQNEIISGINKTQTSIGRTTIVKIKSMHADFATTIECLVLPIITERLPQVKINTKLICLPDGLQLADPNFHEPGTIDLLVGAGLFWTLMCRDAIQQPKGIPRLQNTLLGWIVGGELIDASPKNQRFCGLITNAALQDQLERFWNQEEPREKRRMTLEERECEQQFSDTVRRDQTGRFIVALPTKPEVILGESEKQAARRLFSLERRFRANPEIKKEYVKFMDEYQEQKHMSLVPDGAHFRPNDSFVLPHQPVIRPDSITTKLRVVFDASAKTSLGTALNDKLMVGPNLQNNLFDIILRFRSHEFVITSDIAAMFRQIVVREEDRDLQRVLWRTNETQPIRMYHLNTVTYGTAPAPYLAIRCLRQLAEEETEFPLASRVLREDFYMDDVITGERTIEKTIALQQQLDQLLQKGQFQLRKWHASDRRILENIAKDREADSLLTIDKEGALKTLGLFWDSNSDTMQYSVKIEEISKITKRIVLSRIAQIFDPLGLLGPVIINAKCIMQKMWQLKTGWDELLPPDIQETWTEFYSSLPKINDVRVGRNINPKNAKETFDLVGFGDASEIAYGACLYAVSANSKGNKQSHLIGSKSRVAPLKTVSLPRLELNAAQLLVKLCDTARQAYGNKIGKVYLWSDSTIVLSWISTTPNIRKTYVANRVAKIQELSQNAVWQHVPSKENPADLLSRGIAVDQWKLSDLWWHGPEWLRTGNWPKKREIEVDMTETKSSAVLLNVNNESVEVLRKFSSFFRLQRIIALVFRFKAIASGDRRNGPFSVDELEHAEKAIVKLTQREAFPAELQSIEQGKQVGQKSKLASLNPYVDSEGLLRVGGRLSKADIPEAQKHPVILPSRHNVTKLIIKREHLRLHHCGLETLLCSLRHKYWPLSARRETRKVAKSCLQCFKSKPETQEVMMGDLPSERVRGSLRPFTTTGVDYAGPLQVRESRRRGRVHISKAWIAVFTCFATKAVHLELVTELTTEAFLAELRRFVARRGICSQMFSDNGTNFVGAARELKEVAEFLEKENDGITEYLSRQKIDWKFIPPRAPHFGGLWEAAVKATKRHLNAVTKGLVSTFEEYYTLLVEIESILNSRPLSPISSDPNDLTALTPAHFLVGNTLILPAEHNYLSVSDNRLSRWQHLQKVRQHFWKRWHEEYLQQLQTRDKWWTRGKNLEIGTLVLLKEDHVPPLQWKLGRVVEVHPGTDDVVRVATVKTAAGIFQRAVRKLCPLPTEED